MPRLEGWSIVLSPWASPYQAPETHTQHLQGICSGHPVDPSTHRVTTSSIEAFSSELKLARTKTGTVYELGTPDPAWLKWLTDNDHALSDYDCGGILS